MARGAGVGVLPETTSRRSNGLKCGHVTPVIRLIAALFNFRSCEIYESVAAIHQGNE
jgi:hypothetical protein